MENWVHLNGKSLNLNRVWKIERTVTGVWVNFVDSDNELVEGDDIERIARATGRFDLFTDTPQTEPPPAEGPLVMG